MITILRRRVVRNIGLLPWRSRSQHDLVAKSCPAHIFVTWSLILQIFHRNHHHIETMCHAQHLGRYLEVKVTAWPCSKIVSGPLLCYLKLDFETISQKWSPYWGDVSRATFGLLPWRSNHDLAAKSCPAHNFVIWSRISKLFHRNDHHIEMTCRAQHLGRYLEGQIMTLQQNHVRPITLLFEVGFQNYFTEMTTMLRRRVARKIWVATLKVKVTSWPCSKIVSGP